MTDIYQQEFETQAFYRERMLLRRIRELEEQLKERDTQNEPD